MTKPELLSTEQAADYVGAKSHSLEIWRSTGRYGIPYLKVGRLVRYRRVDLDDWLKSRLVGELETNQ
jgi:excisionase family DNA binding protein